MGDSFAAYSFRNVKDGFSWAFAAGAYGPNSNCDKRFLWEELTCLLGGIYRVALGEISMSPIFLRKDRVKLVLSRYDGVL
jgi:hypothetical protein